MKHVTSILVFSLFLGLATSLQSRAAPESKPMPTFQEMEYARSFVDPCKMEDPFILVVKAFIKKGRPRGDSKLFDGFLVTRSPLDRPSDPRPFLAMVTDAKNTFVYQWIDLDRDGVVDEEGELSIELKPNDPDADDPISDHVCGIARRLK